MHQTTEDPAGPSHTGEVGALLRVTRERANLSLREVADALRIRVGHLEAIEGGAYGDLPGPTYAVGFVRAYADHLGLDSDEVVRRFKAEGAITPRNNDLDMPMPVNDGGLPSGAAVLLGLLLVAAIYGTWYWASHSDQPIAEMVQDVPDRFMALLDGASDGPADRPATPPAADEQLVDLNAPAEEPPATPPRIEDTPPEAVTPGDAGTPGGPSSGAGEPVSPEGGSATEPAPAPDQQAAPMEPAEAPPPVMDVQPPAEEPEAEPETALPPGPAPETETETETETASVPQPPAAPEPEPEPDRTSASGPAGGAPALADPAMASQFPPGGRVYGEDNAESRVILRAYEDSWVQVRDSEGLLLTRLLRAGDSYRVPRRDGLRLMTGNAGGLLIELDGRLLPPLGATGDVRRNIPLDVAALQAGAARPN
jgi:cytoskeletal protein RodZ